MCAAVNNTSVSSGNTLCVMLPIYHKNPQSYVYYKFEIARIVSPMKISL